MQVIDTVQQGTDEWKELRLGKITGTRLGDIWAARQYTKADMVMALEEAGAEFKKSATIAQLEEVLTDEARTALLRLAPRKIGFYETIADRLAIPRDAENPMDRGLRLEPDARDWFVETYKKQVDEVAICISDVNPNIINSPDGLIKDKSGKYTEAIEIKCLSPARHIQAVVENEVPEEYWTQKLQYFVVNPDLQTLYFVFHNPEIAAVPFHVIEVHREELGDWPERLLQFQITQLEEIDKIVERLAF